MKRVLLPLLSLFAVLLSQIAFAREPAEIASPYNLKEIPIGFVDGIDDDDIEAFEADLEEIDASLIIREFSVLPYPLIHVRVGGTAKFGSTFQYLQNRNDVLSSVTIEGLGYLPVTGAPYVVDRTQNLSSRSFVDEGEKAAITGFNITGKLPKKVAIRVRGGSLVEFGVENTLPQPGVGIYSGEKLIISGTRADELREDQRRMAESLCEIGESPHDVAVVTVLDPGVYTAVVSSNDPGASGVALVEVFIEDWFLVTNQD